MAVMELPPPGVYPVWSPCDAYEAAGVLLGTLAVEMARMDNEVTETSSDE